MKRIKISENQIKTIKRLVESEDIITRIRGEMSSIDNTLESLESRLISLSVKDVLRSEIDFDKELDVVDGLANKLDSLTSKAEDVFSKMSEEEYDRNWADVSIDIANDNHNTHIGYITPLKALISRLKEISTM